MAYTVDFERTDRWLRVRVIGTSRDLDSTITAWRSIAAEIAREPPPALLVVSEVQGTALSMEQVETFMRALPGLGLESFRVAYVYPWAAGWPEVEAAEILALEAGFEARAFADEREARVWLQHGER